MCLVSSACLFAGQVFTARGITTRPTRLSMLPPALFRAALASEPFRDFVMGLFAARMADLTALIEAVADHICETLFVQDERVEAVTVKIVKLAISEAGERIGITLTRERR